MPTSFEPPQEFDDYAIVRPLGDGAMGRVYLAEDTVLARLVAIKFIGEVEPDLETRQRFLMEARAAARIQHPNVVTVHRVGELGDHPYLVTELVRGQLLADAPRPMEPAQALAIAIDLARGLAAAHRRGVLHCDIKPANVMVGEDGTAKLVDFGLARTVHEAGSAASLMIGTRDYMAPELWQGRPPSRRTDVYALGAVLYELLAGAAPFADVPLAGLGRAVVEREAPALPGEPDLAALVARCLARDPERRFAGGDALREALEQLLAARTRAVRTDENPYRGLRPFEAAHRGLFFGRELEIGAIVERLRTDSVVVIAGDSGVGKSSLCRAGVVPAIVDGALGGGRTWRALTIVPGRRPLTAFAAALDEPTLAARIADEPELLARELGRRAGPTGGLVLFVDQLEELVTVGDPAEVAAFDQALACLCEGVPSVRLVTTVRADFLARLAALPRFGQELARVLTFVRALPPERLRDVIVGPAAATQVAFESEAMIDELVAATAEAGSGGLPLLSFALAALWEARDRERRLVTQASLDAVGGVAGALARHGDSVLAQMTAGERAHARKALLRLVTTDGTRAPRGEAELVVGADTRAALDALVRGRLLVVRDGDTGALYELAHEALIRGWGTLHDWLTVEAEDRAQREHLGLAAAAWQEARRPGDLLWRGPRLVAARALDRAHLTELERAFVDASGRGERRRRVAAWTALAAVAVLLAGVYLAQQRLAA
ncbi:MAG TPA: serine/threonine-protein kinase, partial [Kofleriaceae bacterium]|nr:serine/threonine-protein kinase [Kofleriaceae bacterium]